MVKVLIVDDSKTVREFMFHEISKASDLEVVGIANDPYTARDKIAALNPDVITLDIEMPRMDGLTFLGKLMQYHPLPVIVVSTYATQNADTALLALELGAVDVLEKPGNADCIAEFGKTLIEKIRGAAQAKLPVKPRKKTANRGHSIARQAGPSPYDVIAIGASTGGTEAIRDVLMEMPDDVPGILIVQHLPEQFSMQFAKRLNKDCSLTVRIAESGDPVTPGTALIAPGNKHMVLCRRNGKHNVEIRTGPRIHCQRPSVDVLFNSIATNAGATAIGVLMTGMGSDGARGLLAMHQGGARTIAQDEASSVVYGMPKVAVELGAADRVVSLARIPREILAAISRNRMLPPLQAACNETHACTKE